MNKQIEQKKEVLSLKKQNSYTYWVQDKNKSKELPLQQQPKKIEQVSNINKLNQYGKSVWNTSGTWQQKKISLKEIENQLTIRIQQWIKCNNYSNNLNSISLQGECHHVFTRNKKTLFYDLKGNIKFQGKNSICQYQLVDVTDHGDCQYTIITDDDEDRKMLKGYACHVMGFIKQVISKFK